jgi:hypothetical protein
LTRSYLAINKIGLASKALIKAARIAPRDPLPRTILGDIYMSHNRIKSAYKAYQKAVRLDPDYAPALEKLGELTTKYQDQLSDMRPQKKRLVRKPVKKQVSRPSKATAKTAKVADKPKKNSANRSEKSAMSAMEDRPLPMPGKPVKTGGKKKEAAQNTVKSAAQSKPPKSNEKNDKSKIAKADIEADPARIEAAIEKLLAGNVNEKKAAAAYLVKLGNAGLIEVEDLLFDPDPEVRIIAARTIPQFSGSFKNRVENILKDALGDPDPMVEKELQQALNSL